MDGAEKNAPDAVAKALGLPVEVIYRVIFAYECLRDVSGSFDSSEYKEDHIKDSKVRSAIRESMALAARRIMLRNAIEKKHELLIPVEALIQDPLKICNGCPIRLECIAESLFTPDVCYTKRITSVAVFPLRIQKGKVDVEANQPSGRYTVPIEAFALKRY